MVSGIVQQIPALASSSLNEFVSGLITSANKGVRIFISAKLYDTLKPIFEKLGIKVREVEGKINADTYILIRQLGIKVKIEVYENGKRINSISTSINGFKKALLEVIEKKKGKDDTPGFYELVLPEELRSMESVEDNDGG